jgi:hypothetical protein
MSGGKRHLHSPQELQLNALKQKHNRNLLLRGRKRKVASSLYSSRKLSGSTILCAPAACLQKHRHINLLAFLAGLACYRLQQLKQIKLMIEDNREAFMHALSADLGR